MSRSLIYADVGEKTLASQVSLDVPEINLDALDLARRHGLTESFGCARMYHGAAPPLPWQNIYGVTTFELG